MGRLPVSEQVAIVAWAVIGAVGGVLTATSAEVARPASILGLLAGLVTGTLVGLRGLLAIAAAIFSFCVATELTYIVIGKSARTIEIGLFLLPWLGALFSIVVVAPLLLGAALRGLAARRSVS